MALIEKLNNIGDAIRSKTGKTDLLTLDEMVTEIGNIETGGGSGGGLDWSAIGYAETPQTIIDGYDYAFEIEKNWDPNIVSCASKYKNNKELMFMPMVDTSKVINFNAMFSNCIGLIFVPNLNTLKGNNFASMFNSCTALTSVPNLDLSKATSVNSMFYSCKSLKIAPNLDTSNVNNFSSMYNNCDLLESIPELDTTKATTINNVFGSTPLINFGGFKNAGQSYLTTQAANYTNYSINLSYNSQLTHDSLMNVINKVYDIASAGVQTQKLQLGSTNTAKLTADEIAIATSKGWTVS